MEKVEDIGLSPEEVIELIDKNDYDGLRFARNDTTIKDSRKVLTDFSLNERAIPVNLNIQDQKILREEQQISTHREALKRQFGTIADIPKQTIEENNFVRILIGNKYILFKKLETTWGIVVVK